MPRKYYKKKTFKKYKKSYKKRGFKKRSRRNNPTYAIVKSPTVVPDQMLIELNYDAEISLECIGPAYVPQSYYFAGNSLYDPDQISSLVGSQPMGYDQWSQFYKSYFVSSSKITVELAALSAYVAKIVLLPSLDQTTMNSIVASEQPRAHSCLITSVQGARRMKHFMSTKRIFGVNHLNNDDEEYVGKTGNFPTGSDPQKLWYWRIQCASFGTSGASDNVRVPMRVRIKYYVKLFNRIPLAQS